MAHDDSTDTETSDTLDEQLHDYLKANGDHNGAFFVKNLSRGDFSMQIGELIETVGLDPDRVDVPAAAEALSNVGHNRADGSWTHPSEDDT